MKNKKGAEINITTIIVIILAILVLVILALYFTGGMQSLWNRITPVVPSYDVGDLTRAKSFCVNLCLNKDRIAFCGYEAAIQKRDDNGQVIGTDTLHCWDSQIAAHKEVECKEAGFDETTCET